MVNNIFEGRGYYSDTQDLATQSCYNTKVNSFASQRSVLNLDSGMTYSEIENQLGYSVSIDGGYGMFSASAKANYLRTIVDKSYSLSLNYFYSLTQEARLSIDGYGLEALNSVGKSAYEEGNNSLFTALCGDNYIYSYSQGAYIIASLYISFSSHEEKRIFEANAEASYGDIVSVSAKIQTLAIEKNINGLISLKAYQEGGDPSRLSQIVGQDKEGDFNFLSCNIQNLDSCKNVAADILSYIRDDFSVQISFDTGEGLTVFEDSMFHYSPISLVGLLAVQHITPEILLNRLKFSNEYKRYSLYQEILQAKNSNYGDIISSEIDLYKELGRINDIIDTSLNAVFIYGRKCFEDMINCSPPENVIDNFEYQKLSDLEQYLESVYYQMKISRIVYNYTVDWIIASNLYNKFVVLLDKATKNRNSFYIEGNSLMVSEEFSSISREELSIAEHIRFKIGFGSEGWNGDLYRNGDPDNDKHWKANDPHTTSVSATITEGKYSYSGAMFDAFGTYLGLLYEGSSTDGRVYTGTYTYYWGNGIVSTPKTYIRSESGYYFLPYETSKRYEEDVITASFQKDFTCNDQIQQTECFLNIDFFKYSYNVENIKIVNLDLDKGKLVDVNNINLLKKEGDIININDNVLSYSFDCNKCFNSSKISFIGYDSSSNQGKISEIRLNGFIDSSKELSTDSKSEDTFIQVQNEADTYKSSPSIVHAPQALICGGMNIDLSGSKNAIINLCNVCTYYINNESNGENCNVSININQNIKIIGTSYDDILIGNDGKNIIWGAGGNDNYSGGGGDDSFVIDPDAGVVKIEDFEVNNPLERIDFSLLDCIVSIEDLIIKPESGTTILEISNIEVILNNVIPTEIRKSNFIFSDDLPCSGSKSLDFSGFGTFVIIGSIAVCIFDMI